MNPYVLLAALLALIGSGVGGYRFGAHVERGNAALRINEAALVAAEQARLEAISESAKSLADAKAAAARRAAARDRQHKLEMEIALDEKARDCRVSDGTYRMLSLAITAANGAEDETSNSDGAVPISPEVDRANGFRPGQVDR